MERAVQDQMLEFMTSSKQLNRNHNAYLRGHSTTTTLLQLTDDIYTANDENMITVLATIDESCAFDCVNHLLLLQKMKLYNFTDATIEWFQSYLKGRSNYVTHNAKDSNITSVIRGVPQGSVLGPVLYTLFTNELPDAIKDDNCQHLHIEDDFLYPPNCSRCGSIPCYADDATIVVTSTNRPENQRKLLKSIEMVTNFLNNNGLIINNSKTNINEIMTTQKRTRTLGQPPTITTIDNKGHQKTITVEKTTRLLGGNISHNLTWSDHLNNGHKAILPTIRSKLGALKSIANKLPFKSKLLLVNGYILSRFCYIIQVWGAATKNDKRKAQATLNAAARFVTKCGRRTSTTTLMKKCHWLTINELIEYHSNITMWNIIYRNIPQTISDHITINQDNIVTTRPARLKTVARSFKHRTTKSWNSLPSSIRNTDRLKTFKKHCKNWIIERRNHTPD